MKFGIMKDRVLCEVVVKIIFGLLIVFAQPHTGTSQAFSEAVWKCGIAKVEITPNQSMWMGGYASRKGPSKGVRQNIWAKAIALEDAEGQMGVMVSMDLVNIPKSISDRIRDKLESKYKIKYKKIALNVSYTN